jgi:Lrp/AsnC family transcriptional regulator, leucine-responsive regulatory protein
VVRVGQAGSKLRAIVQDSGQIPFQTPRNLPYPVVVEIHKLSGDQCSMLNLGATSIEHLEGILERLGKHGEMRTSMVLSTHSADRRVEASADDFTRPSVSTGWTQMPSREPTRPRRSSKA